MNLTINELHSYIKERDHFPELKHGYFQKLIEEVGELAEAIRKEKRLMDGDSIKGTIEEELYDVLYYVIALANAHEINLEECFHLKEKINREKYDN